MKNAFPIKSSSNNQLNERKHFRIIGTRSRKLPEGKSRSCTKNQEEKCLYAPTIT